MIDPISQLAAALIESSRTVEIPRSSTYKQIVRVLARMEITDEEAEELYKTIRERLRFTSCQRCKVLYPRCDTVILLRPSGGQERICPGCDVNPIAK